jgi:hypothetical protein
MDAFLDLIEQDFKIYKNYMIKNKLFDNIKIKISNIILYSPNQNNSFVQSFEAIYPYSNHDYEKVLQDLYSYLNIKDKTRIYTLDHIDEVTLERIKLSLDKDVNLMYLQKSGKELTNLLNKV